MIKAVFVAKDDADLGVRTGDTVELEEFECDGDSLHAKVEFETWGGDC